MFALGLLSWMYGRPTEGTLTFLERKFAKHPTIRDANLTAFQAGWNYGETTEDFAVSLRGQAGAAAAGPRTATSPATWRCPTAWSPRPQRSGLPLFLGSYPITPASDILHELSKHKRFGVRTFQAEDEIAGVGAALGAAFGGALGRDDDLGPGRRAQVGDDRPCRLARAAADRRATCSAAARPPACRPRPSRPTCCRRCSAATARRRCRSSRPARRRTASTRRWRPPGSRPPTARRCSCCPTATSPTAPSRGGSRRSPTCRRSIAAFATARNHGNGDGASEFWPYLRDPETLARPWAIPGTAGLEHRIGGIEKADGSGNISYDPDNHDHMVRLRQAKVDGIAASIAPLAVDDPTGDARLLVLGLGVDLRSDRRGRAAAACAPVGRSPRRTCATSTRSRPTPARSCGRTTGCWCRR